MIACTMSMDAMGITREELVDGLDYGGVPPTWPTPRARGSRSSSEAASGVGTGRASRAEVLTADSSNDAAVPEVPSVDVGELLPRLDRGERLLAPRRAQRGGVRVLEARAARVRSTPSTCPTSTSSRTPRARSRRCRAAARWSCSAPTAAPPSWSPACCQEAGVPPRNVSGGHARLRRVPRAGPRCRSRRRRPAVSSSGR